MAVVADGPAPTETSPVAEELPPAPVEVVTAGETVGPELALSTSEPAALDQLTEEPAEAPAAVPVEPEAVPEDVPGPQTVLETSEPTIVELPADDIPLHVSEGIEPPVEAEAPAGK